MTHTKGNVIVEQIKVGDIHYEYEYGIGIKCEVLTKPKLNEDGDWVWGLSYSPDGRRLLAGFQTEYTFRVWNTGSWDLIGEWAGDQAADLAFSPDGRTFVTAGGGIHEANLWDSASGKQLFNLREAPGWVYAVAYDPRGEYVVSGGIGEVVIMWSVKTGQPVRELYTGPDFVQALAYSPDGSMLASAGSQVIIWNVDNP